MFHLEGICCFKGGAMLTASELAYEILKWCEALYLRWLGVKLITRFRDVFEINQTRSNVHFTILI